ncbi:MAG: metallophosphoesterase [Clostridia bacterium]
MKSLVKQILKITAIICVVFLMLLGVYEGASMFFGKGMPSDVIWSDSDEPASMEAGSLVKKDGEDFRILLFSDMQLAGNPFENAMALKMAGNLTRDTDPDFIMTTGDNASWFFSDIMSKTVIKKMESLDIPWGVTFGNHDTEWIADRNRTGNLYEQAENSLFQMGPANIHGVGNYIVNIVDERGKNVYTLIMLDSNEYRIYDDGRDYDFIYYDQIKWYEWVIENRKDVPSMLFFHIPLPEFNEAWQMWKSGEIDRSLGFGDNREDIFCAPVNTGLFDKAKELGSTTHIFCGHDHINNLSVEFEGIRLTYGLKTGPSSYSDKDRQGATLITILDGSNEVTVEHIYY